MSMRQIHVQSLTHQAFAPFGSYASLLEPDGCRIGSPPIEFFRDQLQQSLGTHHGVSYSSCRVAPRPMIVDVLEYHSHTAETMMALDQDMIVQLGPATKPSDRPPISELAAFHVPRGVMVMLRPGVWHHAPFTTSDRPMHVLVSLPERTYANDCIVVELNRPEQVEICPGLRG